MDQSDLHKDLTDPGHRATETDIRPTIRDPLLVGFLDPADNKVVTLEQPSGGGGTNIEADRNTCS